MIRVPVEVGGSSSTVVVADPKSDEIDMILRSLQI
jgi:hypothetical protein